MEKMADLNKLDGITENLLERIRKLHESMAASLSNEGSSHGIFDYNDNLKPSKSILKKGKSPAKEGRKVSMNASTMVWEVDTDYASPIKPVFNRDAGYLPNISDNKPVQIAKVIGKVSNNGESGVPKNPNPSLNVNANATDFEKDVVITVNTASDKVLNSFASVLKHKVNRVAEIIELSNDECVEGVAVTIPLAAIEEVTSQFENTLYGYCVGNRLAYQVVENYVKNVWAKYGLKRIQLHGEFFLFQFDNKEGMNKVLDYGAWLIRRVPLLLNIWSPNLDLHKTDIKKVPGMERGFLDSGDKMKKKKEGISSTPSDEFPVLSGIAKNMKNIEGKTNLDAYTSDMCLNSWGRSAYAYALIKISADDVLKEDLVIAIPDVADDGFEVVKKKRNKKKKHQKQVDGVVLNKPSLNLHYRRIDKHDSSKNDAHKFTGNVTSTSSVPTTTSTIGSVASATKSKVSLNNSFSVLNDDEDSEWQNTQQVLGVLNESDSDVDEVITFDDRGGNLKIT
uniref:DUF4283 domain-containing protein n=1 Tax=Tanacetum cinerariifolium TaxID=118510 RepID=A0A6L2J611_TANCI|nr:hypothetical protein [Tanacetum cinerariifolium]